MDFLASLRSVKISQTPVFDLLMSIVFALWIAHVRGLPPTLVILVALGVSIPVHAMFGISTETTRALGLSMDWTD